MKRDTQAENHIHKLEQRVEGLEQENDALGDTLYDLMTHVQSVRLDEAFRYPDTVRELLDRAETLCGGDVPDLVGRNRELELENTQLREALGRVSDHLFGPRSAYAVVTSSRDHGHFGDPEAFDIHGSENEHPSACSYRVEQIETVAEIIKHALNNDPDR